MTTTTDTTESHRDALRQQILAYRAATAEFLAVAADLSEADLDRPPAEPEGWTPRMVVHHMADAETNSYVRLRRLLAEPAGSAIQAFDEGTWAQALHYDRPVENSLNVVHAVRESSAELLDLITPVDLARTGVHTESGTYALADWLDIYAVHPAEHAEQIRAILR